MTTEGVTLKRHFISGAFFMAISSSMKFKLYSLIDITETGTRRTDPDKRSYHQQSNFMTAVNTIGLRANPEYTTGPIITSKSVGNMRFGDKYKGKQTVWEFDFEIPFEGALTLDMLIDDFDLVPVVTDLDETVNMDKSVFRTKCTSFTNIIFEEVDK